MEYIVRSRTSLDLLLDLKQRSIRLLLGSSASSTSSGWQRILCCNKQARHIVEGVDTHHNHANVIRYSKEVVDASVGAPLVICPGAGAYLTGKKVSFRKIHSYCVDAFERSSRFVRSEARCVSFPSSFGASCKCAPASKNDRLDSKDESELWRDFSLAGKGNHEPKCQWQSIYEACQWQSDSLYSVSRFKRSPVGNRYNSTSTKSVLKQLPRVDEDLDGETDSQWRASVENIYESPTTDDWDEQGMLPDERYSHDENNSSIGHNNLEPSDVYIPVEAFFIARSVNLKSLSEEPFVDIISGRKHLVIRCRDKSNQFIGFKGEISGPPEDNWSQKRYMIVFQWGSVVLFNFGSHIEEDTLNVVKKHCKDIFPEKIKENYGVLVRPTLDRYSQGGHDKIMVKTLDTNGLRIISLILSQSIALDHYTKAIDGMLTTFGELNRTMELTGNFKLHRKELFQLVAAANTTLADAILRIGLLERSDVAWQNANYDRIWEYLREDFELDERFESLEFKTGIIQHNVKFFLDILQNRKSDLLEWIIIFLIAGEIVVSLYDILHGSGAL